MEYHDLDIVLLPARGEGFVRVARCCGRHGERQESFELDVDALRGAARLLEEAPDADVDAAAQRGAGLALYHGLLGEGGVGRQLDRCIGGAQMQEDAGVRVRLDLDQAPSLAAIPWEFLYLPADERFLASSTQTPLVRYLQSPAPNLGLEVRLPVRVLLVLPGNAAAGDAPLDLAREKAVVQRALAPLVHADTADVRVLERRVTRSRLRSALRGGLPELGEEPFQIVCYAGHGHHDETHGALFLDAEGGGAEEVDDRWLAELFEGGGGAVKLVVLNACQGATVSALRPFAGLAPRLVKAGVPAVVAMQYPVRDAEALCFAEAFYGSLFRGPSRGRVEVALAEARRALRQDFPASRAWGAPVLYTRSGGYLFTPTTGSVLADVPVSRPAAESQREAVREHRRNIRTLRSAPRSEATRLHLQRERRELSNARMRLGLRAAIAATVAAVAAGLTALAAVLPFRALPPSLQVEAYAAWLEGVVPGDPLDGRIVRVPLTPATERARGRAFTAATVPAWRADHARVLDALSAGGARVVAFVMSFPSATPQDTAFAAAIRRARARGTRVVVGFTDWNGALPRLSPALLAAGPTWAETCLRTDEDSSLRVIPLVAFAERADGSAEGIPAFSAAVAAAFNGERLAGIDVEHRRALFTRGPATRTLRFWQMEREASTAACPALTRYSTVASAIMTFSPRRSLTSPAHLVPYEDLLGPGAPAAAARVRGKIALVGRETATDLHPVFRLGRERRTSEMIQTDAVNSVLRGATLRPLGAWEELLAALAAGALGAAVAVLAGARAAGRRLRLAGAGALYLACALAAVAWLGVLPNAWAHLAALFLCYLLVRLLRARFAV